MDQPVVFFGSEGEIGAVAADLAAYLWLLADGCGPFEAVAYQRWSGCRNAALLAIAERFAPGRQQSAEAVTAAASREFPDFDQIIRALCRW